ncbi:NAD(P)-dependent dehydrogenase (short-subunit alcohol dehydrogenase family) [Frondihabitans australicus]|uniref:NAD(P)-dependent dehydrogenase (Short-subunit alcohol dehydrogenase family) n=1 Tax=Frondihabitans australicus TaxID=386892 RepID=A0A495IEE0_9MICO|nr:NAD(P)-dependent dehydrogenase (short-subunit alcohol dehydrogenase family) [Frondihabitans australicus]
MFTPHLLDGSRVLVTGGGSGLGLAIASALVAQGASVLLWGRRPGVLAAAASSLGDAAGFDVVDVRDADAVDEAAERAFDDAPLTGLVNSAAANFIAPTESLSARAYRAVASTVMDGSFHVTHALGKQWIAAGSPGSVVSLLTTWVDTGSAFVVPSAMAKAAVNAMTMSLAVEWARYGIRLNAIAPGPIPTEFAWDVLDPGAGAREDSSAPDVIGATDPRGIPAGRHGTLQEVANLAVFLLSGACDYLTGETIAMDGGQRLAGPATFAGLTALRPADWAAIRERGLAAAAATKAAQQEG